MKIKLFFFAFFCFQFFAFSQQLTLSPDTQISVLTIGPGTSLNDAFGHNAFRVKDNSYGIDLVYGYGEYDFDAPNFYLKFAQGKLNYLLSKDNYDRFYKYYVYQDRTISEQILNLSQGEKQHLFNFLQENYKPENRRYLYDFFYDNCATKMRDVLELAKESKLNFPLTEDYEPKTFRNLIHEHVNRNTWGSFGIDIALGSVIDKEATPYEQMYLPKYIYEFFKTATFDSSHKLVRKSQILYRQKGNSTSKLNVLFSPLIVMSILAFIILFITYSDYKKQKRSRWLDIVLCSITGLIGLCILLLWFATDHSATAQNYNVLWACPLNLFIIVQLTRKKVKSWVINYLKFLIIMLCLLTLHWLVGIQIYAIGLIPLLIALGIRYIFLVYFFKKSTI
ncbi:hypothetical protein A9Q87_05440 [Flavobacteriales bacterium 34_180_T64]|nr:hypothetical protein A9Q87_05440 [Flavobacteriales bacterium 34_180_T64]